MKARGVFLVCLIAGCTTVSSPPPGSAVVVGYTTIENGKLQLLDSSRQPLSQVVAKPGATTFSIQAESAPEFPKRLEAPENYLCVERSTHQMTTTVAADSIYRLTLNRTGNCQFQILTMRQHSVGGPEGTVIASKSTQLSCERRCRFYGPFRVESNW